MENNKLEFLKTFSVSKYSEWVRAYLKKRELTFEDLENDDELNLANKEWWRLMKLNKGKPNNDLQPDERLRLRNATFVIGLKHRTNVFHRHASLGVSPIEQTEVEAFVDSLDKAFLMEKMTFENQISNGILPESEILKSRLTICLENISPDLIFENGDFLPIQKGHEKQAFETLLNIKSGQWILGRLEELEPLTIAEPPEIIEQPTPKGRINVCAKIYVLKRLGFFDLPKIQNLGKGRSLDEVLAALFSVSERAIRKEKEVVARPKPRNQNQLNAEKKAAEILKKLGLGDD